MSSGTSRSNYVEEYQFSVIYSTIAEDINLFNRVDLNSRLRFKFSQYPDSIHIVTFMTFTKGQPGAFNQNTTIFIPNKDFAGLNMRPVLDRAGTTLFYSDPSAIAVQVSMTSHLAITIDKIPELKFIGIRNVWNHAGTADPVNRYKSETYNATTGGNNFLLLDADLSRDWMAFMFCVDLFATATTSPAWGAYQTFEANNFYTKYNDRLLTGCSVRLESVSPFSPLLTSSGVGGPGLPQILNDLTDVNHTAPPANGQVLTYNTATSQWIASTPSAAPALTLRYATKYDFEGLGPKVVLTPVLNTWYSIPIDVFFQSIGIGASNSAGNILVSAVAGVGTLSVSVGMYANVQDTRCEWSLFLAGGYELNSKTPLYSKNSTSESETISTNVWNVDYGPGTTISIRVRFTEDNSPNPVVTQISITKLQITLNQI